MTKRLFLLALALAGLLEPAFAERVPDAAAPAPASGLPHVYDEGAPRSGTDVEAFVARVTAEPDAHAHADDPGKALEHARLLDLVPRAQATHVAVRDGGWFDPDTWHEGRIPDWGAKAFVPEGVSVTYDGRSDAALFTVRVDGDLSFATDADTRMIVDTMAVSPTGRLEIGTAADPVREDVEAEILIAGEGDIDVAWDPSLLSRGVVSHGEVEIHGAVKTPFLKVAVPPRRGDTAIRLAEAPRGWRPGDALVLTGTHKQGWTWDPDLGRDVHRESQDEEVTIASIDGALVTLARPLRHHHDAPRADLAAYVANMSRNVTFATERAAAADVRRRGHVMFMHKDAVDVRYAAFDDLGRTDKSTPAADVWTFARIEADSNVKGRYSLHLHKTGTKDRENPAIVLGNAVSRSPGWGFVHHSSHADFVENVAFDVFGAAFAAEDGDETGIWLRNLAIKSEGIGYGEDPAKNPARHDNGRTGDGFFFAGRLVEAAENVAANTTNGFVWMHRSAPTPPLTGNLHQPEIGYGAKTVDVSKAVIQGVRDNEAFGTTDGIMVVKANPQQGHDLRTVVDGFTNWETAGGVSLSYTAHYTFKDVDLIFHKGSEFILGGWAGVRLGNGAFDLVFNGLRVQGFPVGAMLKSDPTTFGGDDFENVLIDARFVDVGDPHVGFDPARHRMLAAGDLTPGRLAFDMRGDTVLSMNEPLRFDGGKTDSIGTRNRHFAGDPQEISFRTGLVPLLATEGYHTTPDGRNVVVVEDFISDRATGALRKLGHVVTLDLSDAQIREVTKDLGGAVRQGVIAPGGAAPTARDDAASTGRDQDVLVDVLTNDRDPEGGPVRVDGLTDPAHGDVYLQDDGRLLYSPNHGFSGMDAFTYWATDGNGNFSPAAVVVEVSESPS